MLDADALNAIAADSNLRQLLKSRQAAGLPSVITPHPLEAARLLDCGSADVQADRLGTAAALAPSAPLAPAVFCQTSVGTQFITDAEGYFRSWLFKSNLKIRRQWVSLKVPLETIN